MKLIPCLFLLLLLPSCVTSQDIRDVADSLGKLERSLEDTSQTTEEVKAQAAATRKEVEAVAERVEERTDGFLENLTEAEGGGVALVTSTLAALALNAYRNRQRQKRGEPVKVAATAKSKRAG